MPKYILGKERRYQEVQSQTDGDVETEQDWLYEPSEYRVSYSSVKEVGNK